MKQKLSYYLYRGIKFLVRLLYPKIKVIGLENIPEEPALYIGNHSQMNGPIACELYFPVKRRTWCASQMMTLKEVPAYAFQDFWSEKPVWIRWFFKLLSYVIAPISVCVFNNAETVPVYHDMRIRATFKETIEHLENGTSMVIFPEHNVIYNHFLYDFQEHFVDVAYRYYRRTGKEMLFVPFYLAPRLKTMVIGKPIRYRAEEPLAKQRQRIKQYLMDEITRMAGDLPLHTVVPYWNIPKKDYPKSRPDA